MLIKIDFGKYLRKLIGDPPTAMINLHAHHILFKKSSEVCKIASKYIGQNVICRDFKDLHDKNEFDAVWACASILHVPPINLPTVIINISNALKLGGYFYASFKYGDFEGERNGRYFTDLTEKSLCSLIDPFHDLEIIETFITNDVRISREDEKWLNIIIKKKKQGDIVVTLR